MQDFVLALDLDRVIFNTNAYIRRINTLLSEEDMSVQEIFSNNGGRKDIGFLFEYLERKLGEDRANRIMFKNIQEFVNEDVRELASFVQSHDARVVIISVGDGLQTRKVEGFPYSEIFPVHSDSEKIQAARSLKVPIFVDDKRPVVEGMRDRGVNAYQAVWFLDKEHRKNSMEDALESPEELREIVIKLLKS